MILLFLQRYWKVLILALILSVTFYYKTRYAGAVKELATFKQQIATLTAQKEAENALLSKASSIQINNLMEEHKKNLADLNLDRTKVTNNLKGSIHEIRDALTIANDAIKLRNESSSNSSVREVQADTSELAESYRNCNSALATVTEAAKVTDMDYEALYNAWKSQCDIGLCEK